MSFWLVLHQDYKNIFDMDIRSEEPHTPILSYDSNSSHWINEDSGYHTSFTPGSLECSELSNDTSVNSLKKGPICCSGSYQLDRCFNISPDITFVSNTKYNRFSASNRYDFFKDSAISRRGIKRPLPEDIENNVLKTTPTTLIAGPLNKLKLYDNTKSKAKSLSYSERVFEFQNYHEIDTFPSTPVKKSCRKNCKVNSPTSLKRPAQKLNFAMHSLSCESKGLQPAAEVTDSHMEKVGKTIIRPDKKIDIITMLKEKVNAIPALMKILSYLTNEDIYNFTLVSSQWCNIWESISQSSKQLEFKIFLRNANENVENRQAVPKCSAPHQTKPLTDIQNVISNNQFTNSSSPPGTPRTIKFKRFIKTALIDPRKQLSCVRCYQPAKVTEESGGEEWVECTSASCSYQYCKVCRSNRHPGKKCFLYGNLDGASPTKRKKMSYAIGSKASRKNLSRL